MPKPRSYIVTGGAGFVGSNLVAELMRRDPEGNIAVVDSFRSGSFANIVEACDRAGVGPFRGEVIPESASSINWRSFVDRYRAAAVFHLGAITDTTVSDQSLMLRENVGGFSASRDTDLPAACHDARIPLVYASSAATYGAPPQAGRREPFPVEAAGTPNNVYGFSKWLMECEHRRFVLLNPTARIVGLRYFNVFGPGESRKGKMASMVYQLARQLLAGRAPRLFRDGSQSRDQVPVEDVVDCTLAASGLFGTTEPRSGVYNLGSGVATSFNQIIAAVRTALEISESQLPTEYFDMPADIRAFYQDFTQADMSQTSHGLSWRPSRQPSEAISSYALHLRKTEGAAGVGR